MDKIDDGVYQSNDWVITLERGTREGLWQYRASKQADYKTGFVQAWSEEKAAELAALELKEKE